MNVPDEPDNTCPLIDEVIRYVKVVTLGRSFEEVKSKVAVLEEIRSANADLRTRAQFFENEYGTKDEELDKAKDALEKAEARIKELEVSR